MARKVTWTKSARIDLEEVADYIGKDSPNYAGAFVREVRDAARSSGKRKMGSILHR